MEKRIKDCRDDFGADSKNNFFYCTWYYKHMKKMTRESRVFSTMSSDAPTKFAYIVKCIAVMIINFKSTSLAVNGSTWRLWR